MRKIREIDFLVK